MIPWPIALLTLFYAAVATMSAGMVWKVLIGSAQRSLVWALAWLILSAGATCGLPRLRPWGRRMAIWTSGLLMVVTLALAGVLVATHRPGIGLVVTLSTACHYLMIRVLQRPMVKALFEHPLMTQGYSQRVAGGKRALFILFLSVGVLPSAPLNAEDRLDPDTEKLLQTLKDKGEFDAQKENEIRDSMRQLKESIAKTPRIKLKITSPVAGSRVSAGEKIPVQLEVADPQSRPVQLIAGNYVEPVKAPFYRTIVPIPKDATGAFAISVFGGDMLTHDQVTLQVEPTARLIGLKVYNPVIRFHGPYDGRAGAGINAWGVYTDGVERHLSGAETGTTYVSSDPAVASVDKKGGVFAHKDGTATITVTQGGYHATVSVVAEQSDLFRRQPMPSNAPASTGQKKNKSKLVY